jgi:hypothetical protein
MNDQQKVADLVESNIKVFAFVFGINNEEMDLVNSLLKAIFILKPTIIDLADLVTFDKTIAREEDYLFFFGKSAETVFNIDFGKIKGRKILLPEPKYLTNNEENEEERNKTWQLLQGLKRLDSLNKGNYPRLLTKESLPAGKANDILSLEKEYPNGWIGKTEDGKTIRLASDISQSSSEDINMTYRELFALKLAVELLDIKEFELVPNTKTNLGRNS